MHSLIFVPFLFALILSCNCENIDVGKPHDDKNIALENSNQNLEMPLTPISSNIICELTLNAEKLVGNDLRIISFEQKSHVLIFITITWNILTIILIITARKCR